MATPTYDKSLMRQAKRTIREAYKQGTLTQEQISLLEANGFTFSTNTTCTDHLGQEYPSKTAMCEAWGITTRTYSDRIKKGWTVERALSTPVDRTACDHLGQTFSNMKLMCEHWGTTTSAYSGRIKKGWSIEKALTAPIRETKKPKTRTCKDHLGREYPSVPAMTKAWGVSTHAYRERIRKGWSVEDALTVPVKRVKRATYDHLGNEYRGKSAMCKAWGISVAAYSGRRKRGYTLEKALTTPVAKHKKAGNSQ